ncbi:unnamed protein product [Prorocentrum cordatum]|uniref:Uncharacterized protein n=1 Tax=Prorocentrum cordatum TaxID=2364126 RepID=A0ABN9PFN2_9DINO|nr:unnamed protein product [Polarella glacialis]
MTLTGFATLLITVVVFMGGIRTATGLLAGLPTTDSPTPYPTPYPTGTSEDDCMDEDGSLVNEAGRNCMEFKGLGRRRHGLFCASNVLCFRRWYSQSYKQPRR